MLRSASVYSPKNLYVLGLFDLSRYSATRGNIQYLYLAQVARSSWPFFYGSSTSLRLTLHPSSVVPRLPFVLHFFHARPTLLLWFLVFPSLAGRG